MREYDNFLLTLSRSLILNSTDELPMVVNQVTEKVCKFLDCDRVSIWLYQGNKEAIKCESLFLKASATHEKDLVLSKADYQDYFLALENERIIEANDAITHPATSCFAESYLNPLGIKSMYDTPIWKVNDVVGVLCLEYTNQKKVWDIKEKSFFTSLADFLAKIYEKLAVLEVVESLDQKVTERTAQLNQALEDIKVTQKNLLEQERLASLGTVIAGISHEIRNPLNIIHSASQAIQEVLDEDDSYPQEIYKFAEMIHNATHRTNSIIHDMLDISADRKKAIPTDINHLISYCLQLVRHSLIEPQKLNIKITQDLAQINQKILLPRQEIQRVLVNIIENAVQSMATKSQRHQNYQAELLIKSEMDNENLLITVRDNGIGISKEVVSKVFDPFFTDKPPGKGTGLGLSIVHDIITRNAGKVSCDSQEGEFAEFKIQLPIQS